MQVLRYSALDRTQKSAECFSGFLIIKINVRLMRRVTQPVRPCIKTFALCFCLHGNLRMDAWLNPQHYFARIRSLWCAIQFFASGHVVIHCRFKRLSQLKNRVTVQTHNIANTCNMANKQAVNTAYNYSPKTPTLASIYHSLNFSLLPSSPTSIPSLQIPSIVFAHMFEMNCPSSLE